MRRGWATAAFFSPSGEAREARPSSRPASRNSNLPPPPLPPASPGVAAYGTSSVSTYHITLTDVTQEEETEAHVRKRYEWSYNAKLSDETVTTLFDARMAMLGLGRTISEGLWALLIDGSTDQRLQ